MAVEYDISSDVAVIKETGSVSQCARVTQMYSGQITYDDEAGSKFATATINGKSQRVMLCIAVNGTVTYDDVPSLYSTVDGHRCLNIVTPTETGTPDDVPSLYETVVIDGQNVRAVRCIMINKTPVYDGVSSTCTFTGDDGKTHTAQLVNKITGGSVQVIIKGTSPLVLPDAIANSLSYVKAFGGTEQRNLPDGYIERQFIYMMDGSYIRVEDLPISAGYKVEFDFQTTSLSTSLRNYLGGRADGVSAGGGFRLSKLASGGTSLNRVVFYGFETGTEYYDPTAQFAANTRYKYTYDNGVCTLESGGSVISTNTFTPTDTTSTDWGINDYYSNGSWSANHDGMYVYSLKVWDDQGELVMNLVPAVQRGTVPVVGFYDAATGEFRGPTGGTFAAGGEAVPTPDAPMDIVSNNGTLKIQGSATGTVTQTGNPTPTTPVEPEFYQNHGLLLRAIGTDADTYDASTQTITRNIGYRIFDGTESFGSSSAYGKALYVNGAANAWGSDKSKDVLCQYFLGTSGPTSAMPEFSCFFNASGHFYFRTNETATDFKAWLAELYANGTPLIVWFVKSTPATESFTPSVYADGTVETIKLLYNHWDMTKASYSTPGFSVASASVAQDGTFSVTNSSGSSSSRIQLTLSASVLGLINGQKYTLKVFILDGNAFKGSCVIYHGSSSRIYSCDGTQTTLVDSWTQSADNDVKVGMLYFNDYAVGTTVRLRVMVVAGETEPNTYQPYIENTATTETLLKVGDYQDVQSIIDGVVTRNVGVLVLDGTESWSYTNNAIYASLVPTGISAADRAGVCTHFKIGTANTTSQMADGEFIYNVVSNTSLTNGNLSLKSSAFTDLSSGTSWLADQYAAGTPVIVVYPLATPTTESVAGQPLQVQAGDNVLEITQASLTGLELEAQYNAAVSLTIQEVQDANLDNNVIVTIQ